MSSWIRNEWIKGDDGQWSQDPKKLCIVALTVPSLTKSVREIQNSAQHDHYQWFLWDDLVIAMPADDRATSNYLIVWHKKEVS